MNNKNIIKSYEQLCKTLKQDRSEENKQRYMILFKELDLQMNNEFAAKFERLSDTAVNLREEIKRVEGILALMQYRKEFRDKMIADHVKFIGYKPLELEEISHLDDEEDYVAYKTNLIVGNEIICDLIKSGKRVTSLKSQLEKRGKNKKEIEKEIAIVQEDRSQKLNALKANEEVLNDLYDYCLTAPFNEENAYIEYILIKLNPKSTLKIDLQRVPKRTVKKHEAKEVNKPLEKMPVVPVLGSVKPNNILSNMEKAVEAFDDISLPTNGLISNTDTVKLTPSDLKDEK